MSCSEGRPHADSQCWFSPKDTDDEPLRTVVATSSQRRECWKVLSSPADLGSGGPRDIQGSSS
eukprot:7090630-Pyramimonas_sp.AAC.1